MASGRTNEELIELYNKSSSSDERDILLSKMTLAGLFPSESQEGQEGQESQEQNINYDKYGVYPDIEDNNFLVKLFHKREFAENKIVNINQLTTCNGNVDFEVSPVQRFVTNFLSGKTPYYSALLYHGVGVGKTCAAISIAEAFLNKFPRKKVYIIAPPNIQPNFKRTIFDINNVTISDDNDIPNSHNGCTGNLYLELTGTQFEKDKKVIERKVKVFIDSRYILMGYIQLASYIESIKSRVSYIKDIERREDEIKILLQKEFNNRLMIIDEAHNLRDIPGGDKNEDNFDSPGGAIELNDSTQGKKLTQSLTQVLEQSNQMKLVLLTATPMYNSYIEILFLLNLLLINDKKVILRPQDIFDNNGNFIKGTASAEKLGRVIGRYVSYMRGESPKSFPIRLNPPENVLRIEDWPTKDPNNQNIELNENIENGLRALPLVPVQYGSKSYNTFEQIIKSSIDNYGLGVTSIDTLIQSGNWIYPTLDDDSELEDRIRDTGFSKVFDDESNSIKGLKRYTSRIGPPTWLLQENLVDYSPKTAFILKQIRKAEGVLFIYSRFIKSGALPIALALEANGYTPWGKDRTMLYDGIQVSDGRQCALCESREKKHNGKDHEFIAAKYILLTGKKDISPNNNEAVIAERSFNNYDGRDIKIVIGSQVASEGIDLKFIREIYVFDSWFHLNKMEQVLGRGIRTCSHIHPKIPKEKRNCSVYLLVNTLSKEKETADLYMYRIGMIKGIPISKVNRVIKKFALDCNLNYLGNVISTLDGEVHINAQRYPPKGILLNVNDKDYTSLCDYMECSFVCVPDLKDKINLDDTETITYDDYTARFRESEIKQTIKKIFQTNDMIELINIYKYFPTIPKEALFSTLNDIVNNRSFRLIVNNKEGYLTYRNGYYLFQPIKLEDDSIPLSLRFVDYPSKKDEYIPSKINVILKEEVVEAPIDATETQSIIQKFWKSFTSFYSIIIHTPNVTTIPQLVRVSLNDKFKDESLVDEFSKRIKMVIWLYDTMKENIEYKKILGQVLLEFVWDNFLNIQDQLNLVKSQDEIINTIGREQIIRNGEYFRGISMEEPYKINYYKNGKLTNPALNEILNKDTKDIYNELPPANIETTGKIYGFLTYKTKILTLKTANPEKVGKNPGVGRDCRGVSAIKDKAEILFELGRILKETIGTDFDLNNENLALKGGKRKIESANVYCALIEIVLRWMDIKKVKSLRWFYRPISAYKTKHIPKSKKIE